METSRALVGAIAVVALLLFGGLLIPHPFFGSPYETDRPAPYTHAAVAASDDRFDRLVEQNNLSGTEPTAFEDLSPTAQAAVERTVESDETSSGWLVYTLDVCADGVVVCDGVRDPPAEFTYGEGDADEIHTLVAVDGETYLLRTGHPTGTFATDQFGPSDLFDAPTLLWASTALPYAVVLGVSAPLAIVLDRRRWAVGMLAGGVALLALGLATPYLVVYDVGTYESLYPFVFAAAGMVTVAGVFATVLLTVLYARSTVSAQRAAEHRR
ncbi:hypothetical protein ACNS7O_11520 [Haloferacaceae archaeon DSL9]